MFQASAPAVARCSCSSLLQLRVSPAPVQEVGGEKAGSPYLASSAAVHLGQRDMLSGPVTPGRLSTSEWVEGASGSWSVNTAQGLTSGYILGYFISNVRSLGTLCFAVLTSKP